MGLQGALLSHLVEPVYLHSLTVGTLSHTGHLGRAMARRLAPVKHLPLPYRRQQLLLGCRSKHSSESSNTLIESLEEFHSRENISGASQQNIVAALQHKIAPYSSSEVSRRHLRSKSGSEKTRFTLDSQSSSCTLCRRLMPAFLAQQLQQH